LLVPLGLLFVVQGPFHGPSGQDANSSFGGFAVADRLATEEVLVSPLL
jgi:hypothetical protein